MTGQQTPTPLASVAISEKAPSVPLDIDIPDYILSTSLKLPIVQVTRKSLDAAVDSDSQSRSSRSSKKEKKKRKRERSSSAESSPKVERA